MAVDGWWPLQARRSTSSSADGQELLWFRSPEQLPWWKRILPGSSGTQASPSWWGQSQPQPEQTSLQRLWKDSDGAYCYRGIAVALLGLVAVCAALALWARPWRGGSGTPGRCLCLFDVDRTLTAKQGNEDTCGLAGPEDAVDTAFGGGQLLLSELAQGLLSTPCGGCERGIVSNGDASGPREQAILAAKLNHSTVEFSKWEEPTSPFVTKCPNGEKQDCAKELISWFERERGVSIDRARVHLFDDLAENVAGFQGSGMNARQISCGSRDGLLGLCGGRVPEIQLSPGVTFCPQGEGGPDPL